MRTKISKVLVLYFLTVEVVLVLNLLYYVHCKAIWAWLDRQLNWSL